MAEEKMKQEEKKEEKKVETPKVEEKKDEKKSDDKKEEKVEEKDVKKEKKKPGFKAPKKDESVAFGRNLRVSKKHSMYICSFIKNKNIDKAIEDLGDVIKMKKAVPFKGEIPHRKGKGMMSGRYPIKASQEFIRVLKGLKGNILVNGMDLEKTKIYIASASWAARPMRSKGRKSKRVHLILKAKEFKKIGGKK